MLEIHLFGVPLVLVDERPLKLSRRKSRALLYYLAAQDDPVHRDRLLAIFWPDESRPAGLQVLRTTLHGLRTELGADLVAQGDTIGLANSARVDARLFETGLAGSEFDPQRWDAYLGYYRGDFLEGVYLPDNSTFEDWAVIERERYRRMAVRALTTLSGWYEGQADFAQALTLLDRALATNPLQEDLQRESIRLQYLAGDRPGAIRRYDDLRKLLDQEMGVPPMLETRALYDAILNDKLPATTGGRAVDKIQSHSKPLPAAPRGSVAADFRLPFTGRVNEMTLLRKGVKEHALVLIEGEPGIGKTRLVEEYLLTSQTLPVVGRAHELEQHLPYQPMIQALRSIFTQPAWADLSPRILREVAKVWLLEISRLLPDQRELNPGAPASASAVDEPRLWEGVSQFLSAISRQRPLTFFLDDIHWADASTIGLLGYLIRQSYAGQIEFLATSRQVSPRSTLMALIQSLVRDGKVLRLNLPRLELQDTQKIVAGLSASNSAQLADWLQQSSEGNPYILSELIRSARNPTQESRDLETRLDVSADLPIVPTSVYNLIQARLNRLSDAARRILDAGVAAGREFEFEVVFQASGLSELAALDAVDELVMSGLVIPLDEACFKFDHLLTMEVAYQEVGELRHRLLHRRVAEAMESLHRDHPDQIAGLLAWHFVEGNDPLRAAPYAYQAGQHAASLAAWSEAVDFFEKSLIGFTGKQRLPVLMALAEALAKSGNVVRSTEVYREALQVAQSFGENLKAGEIKLVMARTFLLQTRIVEAIEQARQVLAEDDSANAIRAELIWGTALSIEGKDLCEAKDHLLAAQAAWEQDAHKDPLSLAQIQFELGSVIAQQGDLQQAVAYYRQSLDAAGQIDQEQAVEQRILAYNNLAYHLHLLRDASAHEYVQAGLDLAREKGVIGLQAYLLSTLGEIALAAGELDLAERSFSDGLAIAEKIGVKERVAGLTANLGLVDIQRQQPALAIYHLSNALGLADALGTYHLATQIRLWLAPLLPAAEARQRLAEAKAIAEASGRQRLLDEVLRLEGQIED